MTARIQSPLKCVQCGTMETPLWRAGPAGPKTLCNACGVRWKKTGSVIPRAKRPPSSSPSSNPSANANSTGSAGTSSTPHHHKSQSVLRKRARVSSSGLTDSIHGHHHSTSHAKNRGDLAATAATAANTGANGHGNGPNSGNGHHGSPGRSNGADSIPQRLQVDPAARVAAAAMPAPRPISVFRVADVQRSKYESVFSGLMVVHRPRDSHPNHINHHNPSTNIITNNQFNNPQNSSYGAHFKSSTSGSSVGRSFDDLPPRSRATRTRSHTPKAEAFFSDLSSSSAAAAAAQQQQQQQTRDEHIIPPSPSPPPIDLSLANSIYVTEVHAPSPSPSPPPMPKKRVAEGGSFRLVLATVAEERNQSS